MKALRGFLNVILTLILIILLFGLSMTFVLKKVVQEEIIIDVAKEEITKNYLDSDKVELTEEQKNIIKDTLNKKETKEVLNIVIDNYLEYTLFEDYNLSKKDYDKLFGFIENHVTDINKLSEEEIDINYIKEHFTYDEANKLVKEGFSYIDSEGGIELSEDNIKAINTYAYVVSDQVRYYIISGIALVILLLMFVNWSISKWMLEVGIASIISGTFMTGIYSLLELAKEALASESDIAEYITRIDVTQAIIIGVVEILLGIGLIIIKSNIEKSEIKESME
nr:hypothetical protein [Bacilli bacterium]